MNKHKLTQTFHPWRLLDEWCFQVTSRNFYIVITITGKLDCYYSWLGVRLLYVMFSVCVFVCFYD